MSLCAAAKEPTPIAHIVRENKLGSQPVPRSFAFLRPFLFMKGRLGELGSLRGRREPQ